MRTKEEIKIELASVQNDMLKLAHKGVLSGEDEELWKKLFNKQLSLMTEMYKNTKEKRMK